MKKSNLKKYTKPACIVYFIQCEETLTASSHYLDINSSSYPQIEDITEEDIDENNYLEL